MPSTSPAPNLATAFATLRADIAAQADRDHALAALLAVLYDCIDRLLACLQRLAEGSATPPACCPGRPHASGPLRERRPQSQRRFKPTPGARVTGPCRATRPAQKATRAPGAPAAPNPEPVAMPRTEHATASPPPPRRENRIRGSESFHIKNVTISK